MSDVAGIVTARDYGECSFFVDYDNDSLIDIFVKNIPNIVGETAADVPYRNNGKWNLYSSARRRRPGRCRTWCDRRIDRFLRRLR